MRRPAPTVAPLLASAAAALAIAGAPAAAQETEPPLIAYIGGDQDWHAFRSTIDKVATCYMITVPTGEEGAPPGTFAMLALGPEDDVWRVAFHAGGADLSDVELEFQDEAGDRLEGRSLAPDDRGVAWTIPATQAEPANSSQRAIVARMNDGFQMAFKTSSEALATYSLLGIQDTKTRVMEDPRCSPG